MVGSQEVQLLENLRVDEETILGILIRWPEFCDDFDGTFVLHTHPIHIVERLSAYVNFIRMLKQK